MLDFGNYVHCREGKKAFTLYQGCWGDNTVYACRVTNLRVVRDSEGKAVRFHSLREAWRYAQTNLGCPDIAIQK